MQIKHLVDSVIKICPGCHGHALGLKPILRMFGRDMARYDGLRVYCRTCRRKHG